MAKKCLEKAGSTPVAGQPKESKDTAQQRSAGLTRRSEAIFFFAGAINPPTLSYRRTYIHYRTITTVSSRLFPPKTETL